MRGSLLCFRHKYDLRAAVAVWHLVIGVFLCYFLNGGSSSTCLACTLGRESLNRAYSSVAPSQGESPQSAPGRVSEAANKSGHHPNRMLRALAFQPASHFPRRRLSAIQRQVTTMATQSSDCPNPQKLGGEPIPEFGLFVIGAGSGGIASARRAATYGVRVGVAEFKRLGGTCVNVGCVPKKVMWNAASISETLDDAKHYGFKLSHPVDFDWNYLKEQRDKYIARLNGIYGNNLKSSNVDFFNAKASLGADGKTVSLEFETGEKKTVKAQNILIATGSEPGSMGIPGEDLTINSDGFFEMSHLPKRVAVIGAGYIAVELAGVMSALGSQTELFVRGNCALRKFDEMIRTSLWEEMGKRGITLHNHCKFEAITKDSQGKLTIALEGRPPVGPFDEIVVAVGRSPLIRGLNLEGAGIAVDNKTGNIQVDEYQNTNVKGIYALGDVSEQVQLTPTAIAAGRRLADRLFGGNPTAKTSYDFVPTVIFSHPPIGTVGYTEEEAIAKFGVDNVKVWNNSAVNLYFAPFAIDPSEKPKTRMKLICSLPDEIVVGAHVIGMGADEMIQGFGVAVKMGATKADFDNCVAVHPTAAEEFVTMAPWGLSRPSKR